jgi:hypothetical protein
MTAIVVINIVSRRPVPFPMRRRLGKSTIMEEREGYSALFYVMLGLGVIGVIGFVLVVIGSCGSQ